MLTEGLCDRPYAAAIRPLIWFSATATEILSAATNRTTSTTRAISSFRIALPHYPSASTAYPPSVRRGGRHARTFAVGGRSFTLRRRPVTVSRQRRVAGPPPPRRRAASPHHVPACPPAPR